jgi:hypothetical protein
VSFSTAGLSRVPPLQRLLYLESLALSYNHLVDVGSEALAGLSPNLKVRGVRVRSRPRQQEGEA